MDHRKASLSPTLNWDSQPHLSAPRKGSSTTFFFSISQINPPMAGRGVVKGLLIFHTIFRKCANVDWYT